MICIVVCCLGYLVKERVEVLKRVSGRVCIDLYWCKEEYRRWRMVFGSRGCLDAM